MSDSEKGVKLVFAMDSPERAIDEAADRGYLSHVMVELNGGRLYPVYFYDPTRLAQDLEESVESDQRYIAQPGMIVVPHITRKAMEEAVERLHNEGFFQYLLPLSRERLAAANSHQWPP